MIGHGHKVGTLICDADTGRMFAFGRPAVWNGETLNFYFEVSPKPQLKWYNHGDLKLDQGKAVPRRLAEIDAMARMLRSEKFLDY